MPAAQLLMSERNLSQYTIGRGSTSLSARLSSRKSSKAMPPGGLPTLKEGAPAQLNDWRQRFVEVGQLCSPACKGWVNESLPDYMTSLIDGWHCAQSVSPFSNCMCPQVRLPDQAAPKPCVWSSNILPVC